MKHPHYSQHLLKLLGYGPYTACENVLSLFPSAPGFSMFIHLQFQSASQALQSPYSFCQSIQLQLQKTLVHISLNFLSGPSEVGLNIWNICRSEYIFCTVENSAHHYPSSSSFSERQLSSVLARSAQARSLRDPRMLGGLVLVRAHARHLCYLPARPVHSCCQACDAVFCPTTGAGGGGGGVGPSHPRLFALPASKMDQLIFVQEGLVQRRGVLGIPSAIVIVSTP